MKDTRNFDRAPLKDIRVKDNLVGIRTPQVLIKREGGDYMKGDVLDANATTELAKSIHMPDIERIDEELQKTIKSDQIGKPNGVASLDLDGHVPTSQLGDIDTDLFIVVDLLPTEDIKTGKIYCVKDSSSSDEENVYVEYAYLNDKWEEIGRFHADPDLSGYAKLNDNVIFRSVKCTAGGSLLALNVLGKAFIEYPTVRGTIGSSNSPNNHTAFGSANNWLDVGEPEDFIFTLDDGATVTKSIRVISTTTNS